VAKNNNCVAISDTEGTIYSYAQLFKKATGLSQYLTTHFGQVQTVGIYAQPGSNVLLLNISLAMAGITSINVNPDLDEENKRKILEKCDVLIGDISPNQSLSSHLTVHQIKDIMDQSVNLKKTISKEKTEKKLIKKNDLATIAFEKNEKGQWTEVMLSHQNILASAKGLMQIFQAQQGLKVLSTLPLHTAYGYSLNLCLPLLTGMTIIHTGRIGDTKELINAIIKQKVEILFVNDQEVRQLYESGKPEVWLTIETIVTGKDAVAPEIQKILHQDFNVAIHESIGFTKYGAVIAVSSPNYKLKDIAGLPIAQTGSKTNSYGRPIPGIAIKVVDPDNYDIELGANEIGAMLLKGACLSSASNGIADDQFTWVNSGYLGAIDQDGFVKVEEEQT
jgi:acyl-[acyl-carrier-protein]-phospholipid O-acyltransferase/long-chain-fatty-acid--[acyl-carrier-protein] ligase